MIGVIIITHGSLAKAFIEALEEVVGPVENFHAICIYAKDNIDHHRTSLLNLVEKMGTGEGVIILTDLFGGTPSNIALSTLAMRCVEVITGVNLPMLVRLYQIQKDLPFKEAVLQVQEAGKKYISAASVLLETGVTEPVTIDKMTKKPKKRKQPF